MTLPYYAYVAGIVFLIYQGTVLFEGLVVIGFLIILGEVIRIREAVVKANEHS